MAQQSEFLNKQQALAYHVARLPMLRHNLEEAKEDVKAGTMSNAGEQKEAYCACVKAVKQLAWAL